jgi:hypothetical protein
MAEDDWVTLVCPAGAADAAISEGETAYAPYRADVRDPRSLWLVRVPREVAQRLCWNAGFYRYAGDGSSG